MKTLLAAITVCGTMLAFEASAETCSATGEELNDAKANFERICETTYDKTLGHDCDEIEDGWLCTGDFPDEVLATCEVTAATEREASAKFDEACKLGKDCDEQSDGTWTCVAEILPSTLPPEPPEPGTGTEVCELKPVLSNPMVITLKTSGNTDRIDAAGRDVELKWPSAPVTDAAIEIYGARHIVSVGGHFLPTGNTSVNAALELRNQKTGGIAYLERMLIDNSKRVLNNNSIHNDPDAIDKISNTSDTIGFGGTVHETNPTYPSFVMVRTILKGISGQHPDGCDECQSAHADAWQLRGPFKNAIFKDVHTSSIYQGFFGAPANNYYGEVLDPEEQQQDGGVMKFDNVTATVVKPPNLTTSEAEGWRYRASGYYLESYSLRQEGEQSYFNMEVDPVGGMYLEIPSSEDTSQNTWLNFIAGKTVLHKATSPTTATISYIPGAVLNKGRSPNIVTEDQVGPASAPICQ